MRWRVRQHTFAHVTVSQLGFESSFREATGFAEPTTVLGRRSAGDELPALTHAGLPFFKPRWSPSAIGMVIDAETDWTEVAEVVTESYRCCAPLKLVRLLEHDAR